jgi:hypothetical protein
MSVMDATGSAFIGRFGRWVNARLPELHELDDLLASVELYQPEDLPKMIEMLREAEGVCMAAQNKVYLRRLDEHRRRREQLRLIGERFEDDPSDIKQEFRGKVQVEFIVRWQRRAESLEKVRELLEEELRSQETAAESG